MIDFVIWGFAIVCVCLLIKTVIKDFKGSGKTSCGRTCSGCEFNKSCKDLKK